MSLRWRVALAIGGVSALAVAALAVAVVWLAVELMDDAIDEGLRRRIELVGEVPAAAEVGPRVRGAVGGLENVNPLVQLLSAEGTVVLDAGIEPVPTEIDVATGWRSEERVRETEVDGRWLRIMTAPLPDGGAVQVAEDVTSLRVGWRRLRLALVPITVILAGLVASGAWWRAGRLVEPVVQAAAAAEAVARRDYSPARIAVAGPDEIGRLAKSFNRMVDALRLSQEQQRRLVADTGHELRTPLTGLRVKAEFLQHAPDLAETQRRAVVDGLVADVVTLDGLVAELADLASGTDPADEPATRFDLAGVVAAEVDRFRRSSGRSVELDVESSQVEGWPRLVSRALSNLLSNADKFDRSDQVITVRQRGPAVTVVDHGPGIADDERERVFERFHRGPGVAADGSGIGLAIVASVARLHGGRSWVGGRHPGPGAAVGFSLGPGVEVDAEH